MADEMKASRKARKSALTREMNSAKRYMAEDDIKEVKKRLESITTKFEAFEKAHEAYHLTLDEVSEEFDNSETYFEETQNRYIESLLSIKGWLKSEDDVKAKLKAPKTTPDANLKQEELISLINLPKVEIESFNGDPLKFHNFFAIFDEHIHSQRCDSSSKLARLIQYTCGSARDAIRNCSLVGGNEGYCQAREILATRFGDDHLIFDRIVKSIRSSKPVRTGDDLLSLSDELTNCIAIMNKMGKLAEVDNQIFIVDVANRLPNYIRNRWKRHALEFKEENRSYPGLGEFQKFVKREAINANDPVYGGMGSSGKMSNAKSSNSTFLTHVETTRTSKRPQWSRQYPCKACGEAHRLFDCSTFREMKPHERLKFVKDCKLCENCLMSNHLVSECRKQTVCSVPGCTQKHTKFIHVDQGKETESARKIEARENDANVTNSSVKYANVKAHVSSDMRINVHVPVVSVRANDQVETVALLDCASTNSFCTKRLASELGLKGKMVNYNLSTLSKSEENRKTQLVDLTLTSLDRSQVLKLSCVYLVDDIPANVPNVNLSEYPHLSDLPLNPVKSNVEILIGQDHSEALVPLESRKGEPGDPFAVRTLFGWSLNGPAAISGPVSRNVLCHFISASSSAEIENEINKLWSLENEGIGESEVSMSNNDKRVLKLWESTVGRSNGKYVLPIPFKEGVSVPNNMVVAIHRLKSLRISLAKKGLTARYNDEIDKLLVNGHAEKVPSSEMQDHVHDTWYLPHHAVISDKKPGKLRVVFDCSSKFLGESLNDKCLQGPDVNNKLLHVLLRFRLYPFAIMGDIEKMYYQVRVSESDRNYLRFLWIDDAGDVIHYRMTSHVFGGVWSGSAATYALRRTVKDFHNGRSDVSDAVHDSFYVDDCLISFASRETAVSVIGGLKSLLLKGGFNLTKFVTNDAQLLLQIPEKDRASEIKPFLPESDSKALGIRWNPASDVLYFGVAINEENVTRRAMLRIISSVFDPLGIISPVLILARILFQDATRLKYEWDQVISSELKVRWLNCVSSLKCLDRVRLGRCIVPCGFEDAFLELHHFSDASERAYGICSYLRCVNKDGRIHVAFVCGKGKVAPIKAVSIPRLELQAAVLAVRVDLLLKKELRLDLARSTFWVDSQIVLQYISNDSRRFQVFVGNRVGEIRRQTVPDQWKHVNGSVNPADIVSRGATPQELMLSNWLAGPCLLHTFKGEWEEQSPVCPLTDHDPEVRKQKIVSHVIDAVDSNPIDLLIQHYSSWYKLKRAVGWWLKFIKNVRSQDAVSKHLSVADIRAAETAIVRRVQRIHFAREMQCLCSDKVIPKSSPIRDLCPVLGNDGVLHVGGRLKHADLCSSQKHPLIIPHKHKVAEMIAREVHSHAHLGTEWTLSLLRERYWVTKARVVIKRVKAACVPCKKLFAAPCSQQMADIPPERLISNKPPFTFVGLDCFGPFMVKLGRSEVKRYGCVMTCMTTRAVHIEKLDSLDTNSFLNGFRRFVARRGQPEKVWCDNGTNFVGGQSELSRELLKMNIAEVRQYGDRQNFQWVFNPPHASHWGGIWERIIRTIKRVFSAILRNCRLTDEILVTLFSEAENIINSRPITKVNDQCDDPAALTPNHLLLLRDGPVAPPGVFEQGCVYTRRWKYVQFLADQFWRRWQKEYIPELVRRNKWRDKQSNLRIGDIVLLVDENTPRSLWPLGIITEVSLSKDELVRSVKVKTRSSVFVRPITKVVKIEGSSFDDQL